MTHGIFLVRFSCFLLLLLGTLKIDTFCVYLAGKALFGKDEWFFFTPRDRKYPKGSRPKRSAGSGFWKAMGKDTSIFASSGSKKIGVKKALAFFAGNPTKSVKTDWIMIEYRLPDPSGTSKQNGSMRLDDWVLCRIRKKGNNSKNISQVDENPKNKLMDGQFTTISQEFPSSYMTTRGNSDIMSWFKEFQLIGSILAGHDLSSMLETCSPKLLQDDNNCRVYENRDVTFGCFDGAHQGWIN
ncbi:NAC transcription factor 29-like [Bidens hawaiensis]|uniref:NAC transcription factor 29-like n=1 Tax=Bidens hawaiensis TaxID=980011 RepID=UPI00404A01C0